MKKKTVKKKGGRPRKLDYSKIKRLRKKGYIIAEIASFCGCSESSVKKVLKNAGA